MKFQHLIILTFAFISNSTFANKTEEIVMRCESGNGKYTPWLRYINKSEGSSSTVTADFYKKNKSTGKSEWQTQPCLYKEWSSTPKDGKKVTKYVRGVIEGKILSCEMETYYPYPELNSKSVYLTDFEKLKKINRIYKANGELFSDETYSCETLAQKKAKDREANANNDRTYAGVIMGSKFSENEIFKKDGSEIYSISYKYAGLRPKAFFYNKNLEQDYPKYRWEDGNPTLINDPTIKKIKINEEVINKELRDKILESIDSKYQLLSSNTENTNFKTLLNEEYSKKTFWKYYSNKGDEIYVEATDNYNVPKLQQLINKPYGYELKIFYTSKDLAQAEKLAAKLKADKAAKEKAASDAKLKNEISGF